MCIHCKKNPTVLNKITGEVRPCSVCQTKERNLRHRYGITLHLYQRAVHRQKGRCYMCSKEVGEGLVVDFDWTLEKVIGLACPPCKGAAPKRVAEGGVRPD
jgi:hypothetical protein